MTSTRSYRGARPVPEAVAELRKWAGTQFDPAFVDAFVTAIERDGWRKPEGAPASADQPAATDAVPADTIADGSLSGTLASVTLLSAGVLTDELLPDPVGDPPDELDAPTEPLRAIESI
jgi:hypothetical protein